MKLVAGRNLEQSDTSREYVINGKPMPVSWVLPIRENRWSIHQPGQCTHSGCWRDNRFQYKSLRPYPCWRSCQANRHNNFHIALPAKADNTDTWRKRSRRLKRPGRKFTPKMNSNTVSWMKASLNFMRRAKDSRLLNWCATSHPDQLPGPVGPGDLPPPSAPRRLACGRYWAHR